MMSVTKEEIHQYINRAINNLEHLKASIPVFSDGIEKIDEEGIREFYKTAVMNLYNVKKILIKEKVFER